METTNLPNLKINVLTPEQYETAEKNANELYLIGNDTTFLSTVTKEYVDSSKVTVDTALNASSANPVANSAVAAALDAKQPTITGAASTVTGSNLTAGRVLVSNSSGKIAASSSITTTELGYLDGVTSNIQTQLNNLSSGKIYSGFYTAAGTGTSYTTTQYVGNLTVDSWLSLSGTSPEIITLPITPTILIIFNSQLDSTSLYSNTYILTQNKLIPYSEYKNYNRNYYWVLGLKGNKLYTTNYQFDITTTIQKDTSMTDYIGYSETIGIGCGVAGITYSWIAFA